jgi:hypothetical protein
VLGIAYDIAVDLKSLSRGDLGDNFGVTAAAENVELWSK